MNKCLCCGHLPALVDSDKSNIASTLQVKVDNNITLTFNIGDTFCNKLIDNNHLLKVQKIQDGYIYLVAYKHEEITYCMTTHEFAKQFIDPNFEMR